MDINDDFLFEREYGLDEPDGVFEITPDIQHNLTLNLAIMEIRRKKSIREHIEFFNNKKKGESAGK
jgi:hypothetical protein